MLRCGGTGQYEKYWVILILLEREKIECGVVGWRAKVVWRVGKKGERRLFVICLTRPRCARSGDRYSIPNGPTRQRMRAPGFSPKKRCVEIVSTWSHLPAGEEPNHA